MRLERFFRDHRAFLEESYPGFSLQTMAFDLEDLFSRHGLSFSLETLEDSSERRDLIESYFHHLKSGRPREYFLGFAHFYGHDFYVNRHVLIPRQETELLVEMAMPYIQEGDRIADIGTGTGVIALTLAMECPKRISVLGVDLSDKAIAVAQKNLFFKGFQIACENRVSFREGDRLTGVEEDFHMILSNPPYVREGQAIHSGVLGHEPSMAIFLEGDLYCVWYRELFQQVKKNLLKGGLFLMEGEPGELEGLEEEAKEFGFDETSLHEDLAGRVRFLKVVK